jgi:hypothetical protein
MFPGSVNSFKICQADGSTFYHGQTIDYYDKNGNYIRRENKNVLLWTRDSPISDINIYRTFQPHINYFGKTNKEKITQLTQIGKKFIKCCKYPFNTKCNVCLINPTTKPCTTKFLDKTTFPLISAPEKTLYIPLQFWFNRNPGQ